MAVAMCVVSGTKTRWWKNNGGQGMFGRELAVFKRGRPVDVEELERVSRLAGSDRSARAQRSASSSRLAFRNHLALPTQKPSTFQLLCAGPLV